jgi:hypothetical protein
MDKKSSARTRYSFVVFVGCEYALEEARIINNTEQQPDVNIFKNSV